jgi:hypothetical protein
MSVRLSECVDLFLSAWNVSSGAPDGLLDTLPARSREVADLLIQGKQNKWIAWKLGISRDTVQVPRATGVQPAGRLEPRRAVATRDPQPGSLNRQ